MNFDWCKACAQLAGLKQCSVTLPSDVRMCKMCCCALPTSAFSSSQQKSSSKCMMCVEIGPVVEACLFNRCAYCKTVLYDPLTKEHVIPKSLGGSWSPRLACKTCNQQRGTNMNYKAFEDMVGMFPILLDRAKRLQHSEWRWKNPNLSAAAKKVLINILDVAKEHKAAVPVIVSFAKATNI